MPSISPVTILNEALAFLGEDLLLTFPEKTPQSDACEVHYSLVKVRELTKFPWNEAITRVKLTRLSATPASEFAYAYAYPNDCLRILNMYPNCVEWKREGQTIVAHESTLEARYIRDIPEGEMSATLAAVISARMAFMLALKITERPEKLQAAQIWYDSALKDARFLDSQESSVDQFENTNIITNRIGSTKYPYYRTVSH